MHVCTSAATLKFKLLIYWLLLFSSSIISFKYYHFLNRNFLSFSFLKCFNFFFTYNLIYVYAEADVMFVTQKFFFVVNIEDFYISVSLA